MLRGLATAVEIRTQLREVCASLGMKLESTAAWVEDVRRCGLCVCVCMCVCVCECECE